jgi:glycerophosphoryl diester phosphodiesterase
MNLDDSKQIKGIAHRGYSCSAPENTLPAFRLAKEKGFYFVECDVDWTYDGIPVLLHDGTINRTAKNSNNEIITEIISINDISLKSVRKYDFGSWKNADYAGVTIPTFDEFIELCKKLALHPYIEMKGNISPKQADTLIQKVKMQEMLDNVTWISFSPHSLREISVLIKDSRLGYLCAIGENEIAECEILKRSGNEVFLDSVYTAITPELIKAAHFADLPVEAWVVNNLVLAEKLITMGVSGITSDCINAGRIIQNVKSN